jgi:hypothetical protein
LKLLFNQNFVHETNQTERLNFASQNIRTSVQVQFQLETNERGNEGLYNTFMEITIDTRIFVLGIP